MHVRISVACSLWESSWNHYPPPPSGSWKNGFQQNCSLVPKRSGTTWLENMTMSPKHPPRDREGRGRHRAGLAQRPWWEDSYRKLASFSSCFRTCSPHYRRKTISLSKTCYEDWLDNRSKELWREAKEETSCICVWVDSQRTLDSA